uniref:Uncharacterized protein n=1 Tax=Hyaloperonospora arabidopsidis (strain Emoy2) TaxID=559515 RepID=M4B4F9_HYAAE
MASFVAGRLDRRKRLAGRCELSHACYLVAAVSFFQLIRRCECLIGAYTLYDIGVLLPELHHLLLAGLVCLARLFGHHAGHFAEGTWNRISSPRCRQGAEVAGNAGDQTDHPRWAADAPGLGRS